MLASPIHYRKHPAKNVSATSPLLRHLNMGTLALVLFVALALLSAICRKDSATRESAPASHHNAPHAITSADNRFQRSPVLNTGQNLPNTFATVGTNSQFCSIHPRMTEKLIVK
jgi:hypothetical protein